MIKSLLSAIEGTKQHIFVAISSPRRNRSSRTTERLFSKKKKTLPCHDRAHRASGGDKGVLRFDVTCHKRIIRSTCGINDVWI